MREQFVFQALAVVLCMTESGHFRAVPNIAKIALHKIPTPKYDVDGLRLDE